MHRLLVVSLSLLMLACTSVCLAETDRELRQKQAVLASRAFLNAHPDIKYRTEGFVQLEAGRLDEARENFLKAAGFADKPSQAVLAEMAWKGLGQPVDRVSAYVWADIAAERGYPQLVAIRERYWEGLTEEEKARALEAGQAMMAEYGDSVARKRMTLHLRKARHAMIGSRPRKNAEVVIPGPNGQSLYVRGHHFYADEFWEPERYHQWVDQTWGQPPEGTVDIGELEQVPETP